MSTYYGYVERKAEDDINWNAVGKGITDMLEDVKKVREDKKAAIDKESREFGEVLSNSPQSQHKSLNEYALSFADSAQQSLLILDRQFKSGNIKLKDYSISKQNLIDGSNKAFSIIKDYNAKYQEKLKRLDKSSFIEQSLMEDVEGFSNFTNTELYINPTDFKVNVGKKVKGQDGVMKLSSNPNDFSTLDTIKNMMDIRIDKYDVLGQTKAATDVLAKKTEVVMRDGVKTFTSIKNLKQYSEIKENYIKSVLSNGFNSASILGDFLGTTKNGEDYKTTRDLNNKDESKVLLIDDPVNPGSGRLIAKLTDTQEKIARDVLSNQFEASIEEIETARAEFAPQRAPQPTAYDKKMASIQERNLKSVDYMNRALSATSKEEVSAALGDLQSFNDNISKVEKVGNELVFSIYNPQRKQNEIQRVPLSGGKKDIAERALTKILGPDVNVTELIKDSGIGLSGNVSNIGGKYERTVEVQKAPLTDPASFVFDEATQSMQSPKTIFTDKIKDTATPEVAMATRELLNSQGIKAEVDITGGRRGFGAYISGKSKPGYVNIKFDESVVTLPDTVKDFKETMFNVINEINNASLENRKINESLLSSLGAKIQPKKTLDF